MNEEERVLMYGAADNVPVATPRPIADMQFGQQSVLVTIDGRKVELPTFGYIRQLTKEFDDIKRKLIRVEGQNRALRARIDAQKRIGESLKEELSNKLDMR